MADVILFRPRMSEAEAKLSCSRPPLALLYIAAPLIKHNYTVKIIDEEITSEWAADLDSALDGSTLCVGVSAMTGRQISSGIRFCAAVKRKRAIPCVWGGIHPSMLPEQTVQDAAVDIAVRGEGDHALLAIVDAIKRKSAISIPDVYCKNNAPAKGAFVDLDAIGSLPHHLVDCEKYVTVKRFYIPGCNRIFDVHTDRGCPHRCSFCYNQRMNNRHWRAMSSGNVIERLDEIVRDLRLDGVDFVSDNFFVDKKRVVEICEGMIKKEIRVGWHSNCRIDYLAGYDDSFMALLKKSGCVSLSFGVESGSEKILGDLRKDIAVDDVFRVNRKMKRWGLVPNYGFMVGFPGETKKDALQTYEMMFRLHQEYPKANLYGPCLYTPYPGTDMYDTCVALGFHPPQKLTDWSVFEFTNDQTALQFIQHTGWLKDTLRIMRRLTKGNRIKKMFFALRAYLLIKTMPR